MQRDRVAELFGLAGTFPRPGWVVLDAARDHRYTGELVFDTSPVVRVYVDRGVIYLAERATDPSIGARLVDAGALTATQLERGSVRVGEVEHLGRLFDRVPELDRHTVMVTAELMTEECAGWLAGRRVPEVQSTPYRHHASGVHLWDRTDGRSDLRPGDPLPAPPTEEEPVALAPPLAVAAGDDDAFLGEIIQWNEPSWLDGRGAADEPPVEAATDAAGDAVAPDDADAPASPDVADAADGPDVADLSTDWVDRLDTEGLPESDPLMAHAPLPRLGTPPLDRFEIVWPSGEIDEDFGAVDAVAGNDHDRVGSTARLARPEPPAGQMPSPVSDDLEQLADSEPEPDELDDDASDEVVLAVRRAVASIEVGSLAIRQRLVTPDEGSDPSRGQVELDLSRGEIEFESESVDSVAEPGRLAVRSGRNDWSQRSVTRSVFDEPAPPVAERAAEPSVSHETPTERRAGALRRLIASLRR